MNCEDVNDLLDEYINGETDNAVSSEIEAHIRTCENCRMQYEELKSLKAELASLAEPLPDGFEERLLARLRHTKLKRLLCTGIPGIGAAAAILLVCVVIGGRGGYKYLEDRELSNSVVQSVEDNGESAEAGGTQGRAAEGSDTDSTDEAQPQAKAADTETPQAESYDTKPDNVQTAPQNTDVLTAHDDNGSLDTETPQTDSYDTKPDNVQTAPQNKDVRTAPDDGGIADTGNAKNSADDGSTENFTQAFNNASENMNGTEPSASKMRIGSAATVTASADENTADKSIEADESTAELFEAEEDGMPMPRASGGGSSAPRMEQSEEQSADVIFTCDTDILSEIADKLEDMPQVSFTYRDDVRIDIHCEGIKYGEIKALLEETGAKQTYADISADELSCDVSIKAARQR